MKRELFATAMLLSGALYAQGAGNVLVIVADDLGKEVLSLYDTPAELKANTPNINSLAQRGVLFDNVWGCPLSAPVRAAMLTGRYGHHNSILSLDVTLPLSEKTLFEALPKSYSTAVVGKWHLSKEVDFAGDYGIDYFAGIAIGGGVRDYDRWQFTENGKATFTTEYATTKITDSAKEWIEAQKSPWVCWVAYNAPHTPLHLPPSYMHTHQELTGSEADMEQNPIPYFLAMVESLDYDIGRLLESVDDSTTIIFIGDNGTEKRLLQSPYNPRHGKGTLYDSGVAIPMIVCGGAVTERGVRSEAMVSAVDIFPSVMEFAGEKMPSYEDSYSFASVVKGGETLRQYNFSEILNRRMGYMNAVSDGRYKLITTKSGTEEFYDTRNDIVEQENLIGKNLTKEQQEALDALRAELKAMDIPLKSIPDSVQDGGDPTGRGRTQERGERRTGYQSGNMNMNSNRANIGYNNYNNNNFNNRMR